MKAKACAALFVAALFVAVLFVAALFVAALSRSHTDETDSKPVEQTSYPLGDL